MNGRKYSSPSIPSAIGNRQKLHSDMSLQNATQNLATIEHQLLEARKLYKVINF